MEHIIVNTKLPYIIWYSPVSLAAHIMLVSVFVVTNRIIQLIMTISFTRIKIPHQIDVGVYTEYMFKNKLITCNQLRCNVQYTG